MLPNWLYGKSLKKLQEIFSDGSTPPDYNEVKAKVAQNTEDIALLNNTVAGKVGWDGYSEIGAVNIFDSTAIYKKGQSFGFGQDAYTMNDDCSITVNVSSVTNTGSTRLAPVNDDSSLIFPAGTYKLSGEGSTNNYFMIIRKNGTQIGSTQNGESFMFQANGTDYFTVLIRKDTSAAASESFVIYPMIVPASYNGPYVPPAMTNREITNILTADANLGTAADLSTYTSYSNLYTAPSDGYVHFLSAASGSAARTIYTYGNNTTAATDPHFTHSTSANNKAFEIFIKKGLKVYIDGLQSGDIINFYPLS